MGFATHLGPWLLGTVKNTTGTTAGTIRNMGATVVGQTDAITYADAAGTRAFVLPAGAIITAMDFITTAAFSSAATLKLTIGATDITTATTTTTTTRLLTLLLLCLLVLLMLLMLLLLLL